MRLRFDNSLPPSICSGGLGIGTAPEGGPKREPRRDILNPVAETTVRESRRGLLTYFPAAFARQGSSRRINWRSQNETHDTDRTQHIGGFCRRVRASARPSRD